MGASSSTLTCHWCGTPLGNAAQVTYLNGNLPVCDLCLVKANNITGVIDAAENTNDHTWFLGKMK